MLKILNPSPIRNSIITHASASTSPSHKRRDGGARKAVAPHPPVRRPSADRCAPWAGAAGPALVPQPLQIRDDEVGPTNAAAPARDELALFLELVPPRMRRELATHEEVRRLVEVVMDLGRKPIARFPSGDYVISEQAVDDEDLRHAVSKVGDFSEDNRSGINRSLHRISAIRNRKMQIIGLTCRVGRAISGSAEMIRDLVESGGSILVIGPPGAGKTTLIREIARILADEGKKRVVIVDTSNEIGGDGDVPHSGIGRARRMQVPKVSLQHNVMIEAVENHMPEVIVIDEIGTELEAMAASTIAQRGVQLVGTAHGVTIDSIIKNPCLQMLVGGIESVTLGDEEAKKRKVQKTILERKGPPTFSCAVEMISKSECQVHHKLEATVDAILAGKSPSFEFRKMDSRESDSGRTLVVSEKDHEREVLPPYDEDMIGEAMPSEGDSDESFGVTRKTNSKTLVPEKCNEREFNPLNKEHLTGKTMPLGGDSYDSFRFTIKTRNKVPGKAPLRVYTYQVSEDDLLQVATVMGLEEEIVVTDDVGGANAILVLNSELKQNPWIRNVAKHHQLPIFVIKANTMAQIVKAVKVIVKMDKAKSSPVRPSNDINDDIEIEDDAPVRKPSLEEIDALEEARLAIEYIVIPSGEPVELLPRCSEIIALQLELVKSYQLAAETSGTDLNSRLNILPIKIGKKSSSSRNSGGSSSAKQTGVNLSGNLSGGATVSRLPLLPE